MRRNRNPQQKRRSKVNAAQAAMGSVIVELVAKYGDNFTQEDV